MKKKTIEYIAYGINLSILITTYIFFTAYLRKLNSVVDVLSIDHVLVPLLLFTGAFSIWTSMFINDLLEKFTKKKELIHE